MTTAAQALGTFVPYDNAAAERWQRLCALVEHGPQVFSRDTAHGGHITASALVLSPERDAALLTHHRKLGMWLQLGGHCDGIIDTGFVALKEAYEESGLRYIRPLRPDIFDVDILPVPAFGPDPAHLHYDVRYLMQASDRDTTVSEESHDLAWVRLNAMEEITQEQTMLRMRDAALRHLASGSTKIET